MVLIGFLTFTVRSINLSAYVYDNIDLSGDRLMAMARVLS
jgi:hypothetical protein